MLAVGRSKHNITWVLLLVGASLPISFIGKPIAAAQEHFAYLRWARAIAAAEVGIAHPSGLAFLPAANTLLVLGQPIGEPGRRAAEVAQITLQEGPVGPPSAAPIAEPLNVVFDDQAGRLIAFDQIAGELIAAPAGRDAILTPRAQANARVVARISGIIAAQGMTRDPRNGRLFILDAAGPRIVRVEPERAHHTGALTGTGKWVSLDLNALRGVALRGIALNPSDGHLYLMSPAEQRLYELSEDGQVLSVRELASLQLQSPQALVFAPSGDPTDDPARLSLYIADSGLGPRQAHGPRRGQIVEVSLTPATLQDLPAAVPAAWSRTIRTSQWSPPSPDPTGIAYLAGSGRMLVSDSEVDEMQRYFTGMNLFETATSGTVVRTHNAMLFTNEPADVTVNPNNGHLFFADDNQDTIFEVNLGADRVLGTADDSRTSFSTRSFNSFDPEGLAFGQGKLFVSDGGGAEVYIIDPGPNQRFDGAVPVGDDRVTHFDTASLNQPVPEGIAYNADKGTLYLVSNHRNANTYVTETTTAGRVVRVIDFSAVKPLAPSGLAYAPSSKNALVKSLYITDRRVDNDADPTENDGTIYEISLDAIPSPTSQHHRAYAPVALKLSR